MITLEEFTKVFNVLFETQKYFDDVEKVTKVDLFETPVYENCFKFFDFWVDSIIKEEYVDTISAYVWPDDLDINGYDRSQEHPLELFYNDGAVNKIGTIEQLYTYLKENDGFRTNC